MSGQRRNRFAGDQWRKDRVRPERTGSVRNRRWRKLACAIYMRGTVTALERHVIAHGVFRRYA